jgi:hypothetical protein
MFSLFTRKDKPAEKEVSKDAKVMTPSVSKPAVARPVTKPSDINARNDKAAPTQPAPSQKLHVEQMPALTRSSLK